MLTITLNDGNYEGAAGIPQTLQGPYFSTFIDATKLKAERKHHFVSFAHGSYLDRELKKAIMDVIPRNQFQKGQ